jgi:hypothetical protein
MSVYTADVIQVINDFQWLRKCKTEIFYVVFFCEFPSFQHNENRNNAEVLPNNTFIASRPITNNYLYLRTLPNPYHSQLYSTTSILFPSFLLHPLLKLPLFRLQIVCVCLGRIYEYLPINISIYHLS